MQMTIQSLDWLGQNWPNWSKTCRDRLAGNWDFNWPWKSGRKLIASGFKAASCSNWGKGIWRKLIYDSITEYALCECRSRLRIHFAPVRNEQLIQRYFQVRSLFYSFPVEKFRFFSFFFPIWLHLESILNVYPFLELLYFTDMMKINK